MDAAEAVREFAEAITAPLPGHDYRFNARLPNMQLMGMFDSITNELGLHLPDLSEDRRVSIAEDIVRRLVRDWGPPTP